MTISDLLINFIFSFAVTAGFSIFFNSGKSWATAGKQVKSSNAKSNVIRFANAVPVPVSPYVLKEYLSPWMFKVGALRESP